MARLAVYIYFMIWIWELGAVPISIQSLKFRYFVIAKLCLQNVIQFSTLYNSMYICIHVKKTLPTQKYRNCFS